MGLAVLWGFKEQEQRQLDWMNNNLKVGQEIFNKQKFNEVKAKRQILSASNLSFILHSACVSPGEKKVKAGQIKHACYVYMFLFQDETREMEGNR